MTQTSKKTHKLVVTALLSAVAFILMFIEIQIPVIFPPWLKLDFSDIPALLAAFSLGPVSGAVVEAIKVVLFFFLKNSGTAGIGELSNFIMGIALVLPAGIIYIKRKTKKNAIIALVVGILMITVASGLLNYYLILPTYSQFLMPIDAIINMCAAINPSIQSYLAIVLYSMLFTFLKVFIDSIVIILLYKKLSPILHK